MSGERVVQVGGHRHAIHRLRLLHDWDDDTHGWFALHWGDGNCDPAWFVEVRFRWFPLRRPPVVFPRASGGDGRG
jgi:hypothetical protein